MLAVDTNVVIRFLANDNAAQHKRAVALFRAHDIWLTKTVLLESEWVLRSAFGFGAGDIAQAFRGLIHLPNVHCEDRSAMSSAIDALAAGMDFADALHFVCSGQADEGFASFDARFVKRARKHWPDTVIRVP
ncbi:MAG: type II toxin-antitoxin system VapC family toxin [Burkholderiales bacterium]|nr:type II toxin-antitoxin system VapC family toxin [Burkholderiales bacterium]